MYPYTPAGLGRGSVENAFWLVLKICLKSFLTRRMLSTTPERQVCLRCLKNGRSTARKHEAVLKGSLCEGRKARSTTGASSFGMPRLAMACHGMDI